MINQQLLDYIKQQLQQGVGPDQIKNTLISGGWQTQDVEEGFRSLTSPTQKPTTSISSATICKIILGLIISVVAIAAGIYLIPQTFLKSKEQPEVSSPTPNPTISLQPTETVTPTSQPVEQNVQTVLADKLDSCTPFKTTFQHPLTGDILGKEIIGIVDGKCNYTEQMPNGGKMECKYTESERKTIAQYYKDTALAESVETKVKTNPASSNPPETTYILDGKTVSNPAQEAINNGVCIVSGY